MKIIVMGGGVIGVSTAYALARDGHEVTVLDRREDTGLVSSFQNGGLLAPGHAVAWASPAAPLMLMRSFFERDPAIRLRFPPDLRAVPWGLRFLTHCTGAGHRAATLRALRLARYSLTVMKELRAETGIEYDSSRQGILYIFRSQKTFERGIAKWNLLRAHGLELEVADSARCVGIEPALGPMAGTVAGGAYCPTDEGGDAHLFTRALAQLSQGLGVTYRFGVGIAGLEVEGGRVAAVATDRGRFEADAYVLALGTGSPAVGRTAGLRLPIYPIKGYTISIPAAGGAATPSVGLIDEDNLVSFSRLGDRLRIGGKAELAGDDDSYRPADFGGLLRTARGLFPEAGDYDRPERYACLRPVTPGGPPILGLTRHANLYLNAGHGMLGWTMACGSARVLADLIAGRPPEIDLEGLTLGS